MGRGNGGKQQAKHIKHRLLTGLKQGAGKNTQGNWNNLSIPNTWNFCLQLNLGGLFMKKPSINP